MNEPGYVRFLSGYVGKLLSGLCSEVVQCRKLNKNACNDENQMQLAQFYENQLRNACNYGNQMKTRYQMYENQTKMYDNHARLFSGY